MRASCTICARDDRDRIDEALASGLPALRIGEKFGVGRNVVTRHALHAGLAKPDRRAGRNARRRVVRRIIGAAKNLAPIPLETPADVAAELRALYREARELLEAARVTGDPRLSQKALADALNVLTQIGRATGLFRDEPVVIDRSTKVLNIVGRLSDSDLERLIRGEPVALPETIEGEVA